MSETRSSIWRDIWANRDPDVAEFNGYENAFADRVAYHEFVASEAAFLIETLHLGSADRVLDLGCGTGLISSLIAPHVDFVLAFDYSPDALNLARARCNATNIEFRQVDLAALELSSLTANKAYAVGSFHYLDDYETAHHLLTSLLDRGIDVAVLDIPDEGRRRDEPRRNYDTGRYTHLCFDEERLRQAFPGITVFRGLFPTYPNDPSRFSFCLRHPST